MSGSHPRVISKEHISRFDPRVFGTVFENPFDLCIRDTRHVLHVWAEVNELRILRKDRGV